MATSDVSNNKTDEKKREDIKELLDDLLVGFDCSHPSDVKSHEIDSEEVCQIEASKVHSQNVEMQVLQRSNKISVNAKSCSLRRTRVSSFCGNAHQTTNIDFESFYHVPQTLERKTCIEYHNDKLFTSITYDTS